MARKSKAVGAAGMTSVGTESNTTAADTALYIGGLARELRELAAKSDLGFLAYLLASGKFAWRQDERSARSLLLRS